MRLFFAYDYKRSGTESVLNAMAVALRANGHEVITQDIAKGDWLSMDLSLRDFDAAHFWNKRCFEPFMKAIRIPYGFTSHGFGGTGAVQKANQQHYIDYFRAMNPYWMHTMDGFTLQTLGREGIYSFWTPQCITQEGFPRLPKPAELTIGCIGHDDDGYKRHWVMAEAAKACKVPLVAHNSSDGEVDKDGVIALYNQMGVCVNAAFGACGPVPPQEALLCGRPVISTRLDTMVAVIKEGVNGEFFDGSPTDLAKQAKKIFSNYDHYYGGTAYTVLLSAEEAAQRFLTGIEDSI